MNTTQFKHIYLGDIFRLPNNETLYCKRSNCTYSKSMYGNANEYDSNIYHASDDMIVELFGNNYIGKLIRR